MNIPDGLEKLLPPTVIEKAYTDAISPAAKESSKIAVDLVKTARLFLAPFQLAAAFQDRFERLVSKARDRVPAERQCQAPPEIVGPAIQHMRFIEETNPLWKMFEELLTSSIDANELAKVHPSFVYIISQLSRDEAVILYKLSKDEFEVVYTLDLNKSENRFENRKVEKNTIPEADLIFSKNIDLYYSHLESLSLVTWPVLKQDPMMDSSGQTGIRHFTKMHLTDFGRLFVKACVPENGF